MAESEHDAAILDAYRQGFGDGRRDEQQHAEQQKGDKPEEGDGDDDSDGGDGKKKGDDRKGDDKEGKTGKPKKPPFYKRPGVVLVILIVLIVIVVLGVLYWLHARRLQSTDDAFVDGHVAQVAPQVGGRVIRLLAQDNRAVKAGDMLVEIDPRDFQVKLDQAIAQQAQAEAQLGQSEARLVVQIATAEQAQAQVDVAAADLDNANKDYARYKAVDKRAISQQQLDQAEAQAKTKRATLEANRKAAAAQAAQIASSKAEIVSYRAALEAQKVAVANARLQLSYTTVVAPQDGLVTNRTVEVGNYVAAGASLLAIVSPDLWVTANFKETQLQLMRPGQAVELKVDGFPDRTLNGRVDSIQAGSGAHFSLLPPENATGNYVKVVQRVPVKIVFADGVPGDMPIGPGLSVVPTVTVRP